MKKTFKTMDGNEAVAAVAFKLNEVIAIYPITPSSPMGEWADAWASERKPNLWGTIPSVIEMQSEGGAAGVIHGALQTGSLATTFTCSQGLLLMIPNMYKIAGELTPAVFHVAARSLAACALSIFGDHSDVMAARATGFGMLASCSVQEAADFAAIVQAATLEARVPFIHFFDGFRTSHEISKVELPSEETLRGLISEEKIAEHRARALSPDHPVLRGTSQNPDVYFQSREAVNAYYQAVPAIVENAMQRFKESSGREYHLYEYEGHPEADRVIVLMGSGAEAAHETAEYLNRRGEKVGLVKVRLFRPFDLKYFTSVFPRTVKKIAVLDRTKEAGSVGEPLYLDCVGAFHEAEQNGWKLPDAKPVIVGGRYGLSSKEFTPAMIKGVFDELKKPEPSTHFTIGIEDDLTWTSLPYDPSFSIEPEEVIRAVFYGLGSDGTVGANKNSIKIIGENTENYTQAYFVYDSRKAGAMTVSHLRFGPEPIRSSYLVTHANFVACHQPSFLGKYEMLKEAVTGGTFLLNTHYGPDEVWKHLPVSVQKTLLEKKLRFYVIDAYKVALESGLGAKINTVMQVCFFAVSGVLARDKAIEEIRKAIQKTYGKKGEQIVQMNLKAVDETLSRLYEVRLPERADGEPERNGVSSQAPEFVKNVLGRIMTGHGDALPVSAFPSDGTYPTGTSKWEKRNLAQEIPVWDEELCIQCGKCAMVCPHSVIRIKVYEPDRLSNAPVSFKSRSARDLDWKGLNYTIQVAPEDCTGCTLCVDICPARSRTDKSVKALVMKPKDPILDAEKKNWDFFLGIPELDRRRINAAKIPQQQVQQPLFEFSSACVGCGETPYIKLASQLFGDRMLVANATGCSSIFGGNLPVTPWSKNAGGLGPAWSNSLFEDNAEFGLGFRVSIDKQTEFAKELLRKAASQIGSELAGAILDADQKDEAGIYEQRARVALLKKRLAELPPSPETARLLSLADMLVKKSVWIMGGDGWAYDIGFSGLDHVLASGRNVNILVLDTEVYSNTGGQMSKATPLGAVAKFASDGKRSPKKDLGLMAMTYGSVYVAKVALGARDEHTLKAFLEAEAYDGPSLIIAYSHCIAHGIQMTTALHDQKAAVESGQWLLYRFHPDRLQSGQSPLTLDSRSPKIAVEQYLMMENRFRMLIQDKGPEEAKKLFVQAQKDVDTRWRLYEHLSQAWPVNGGAPKKEEAAAPAKEMQKQ
jgi:pyruvate-ferredoxin/flavodoxin oxidoreductase